MIYYLKENCRAILMWNDVFFFSFFENDFIGGIIYIQEMHPF